jgi:exodeoxyribonuclease V alpha subunit
MNAAIPECKPVTEEISGLIERGTFHNDKSGFCVRRENAGASTGGYGNWGTALCHRWGMAGRRGLLGQGQRAWAAIQSKHDEDGSADHGRSIERYIGSGLVKGIGPVLAKKLVEKVRSRGSDRR